MNRLRAAPTETRNANRHLAAFLLSFAMMGLLYFYFKAPLWVMGLFTVWMPIVYLLIPWDIRRRWTQFEKNFTTQFQRGEYQALLDEYRNMKFLRRFGPKAEMLSKLAIIYTAMEHLREAEKVLEQAIDITPLTQRDRLYLNLANLKYELGKYNEAAAMYKALQSNSPYRHSVKTQLALIDLHQGHRVAEARAYLADVRDRSTGATRSRIDAALSETES